MSSSESIVRTVAVFLFGMLVIIVLSEGIGLLLPVLKYPSFFALGCLWAYGMIGSLVREHRGRGTAQEIFNASRDWDVMNLPIEFRFIGRETTLREVSERLGPYSRIRGDGDLRAIQFDLPSGGAVILFPESSFTSASKIRGALFFPSRDNIPLFP